MKRIVLLVNECRLDVYVEGDFDRVELGQAGQAPFNRHHSVTIIDDEPPTRQPGGAITYTVRVLEVEDL